MLSLPYQQKSFLLCFKKTGLIYLAVLLIELIIMARFPITNDESYYIAFAKHPQLSYLDAPPFVSYLTIIPLKMGISSPLSLRFSVFLLHLLASFLLMHLVYKRAPHDKHMPTRLLLTFLISYLVPIFGLYGVFILPDVGLIAALSLMLWVTDDVVHTSQLRWSHTFLLGVGLGIGLLAKYHILPLGGGLLLGLLIDLSRQTSFRVAYLMKLAISTLLGLVIALPVFIWNYEHHMASFVFQLQHGFRPNGWHIGTVLTYLLGSALYLTPPFAYLLITRGLWQEKKAYLFIPVGSLFGILLISSLHNRVLPHWISPAFWLLIPYLVLHSEHHLAGLKTLCRYTALIWVVLVAVLLIPGGLTNIKEQSLRFHPDAKPFQDLLLWEELPYLLTHHPILTKALQKPLSQPIDCHIKEPIVGSLRWFWTSQLEYHQVFPGARVLNWDLNSSNFYLWRDRWADYAHCRIVLIGSANNVSLPALQRVMTIEDEQVVQGLGDYSSLTLDVIHAKLKDTATLQKAQDDLLNHPHY